MLVTMDTASMPFAQLTASIVNGFDAKYCPTAP